MPAHQQLCATICAGLGGFALAEQRMPRQINPLIFTERARPPQVIAIHCDLAQIMGQRGNSQREAIARAELKGFAELIGNRCNPRCVRIRIAFKPRRACSLRSLKTSIALD